MLYPREDRQSLPDFRLRKIVGGRDNPGIAMDRADEVPVRRLSIKQGLGFPTAGVPHSRVTVVVSSVGRDFKEPISRSASRSRGK